MRAAVIDLGTHTILLLVVDITGDHFTTVRQEQRIVGLGKGIGLTGVIDDESVERATSALKEYRIIMEEMGVRQVRITATAVLRDPANADAVKSKLENSAGYPIRVISGEEEARAVYAAGGYAFSKIKSRTVIDIGGGSVEFVQGKTHLPDKLVSLPLGAVKLTERFITAFPVPEAELCALQRHLAETYARSLNGFDRSPGQGIIGVAGTFTTASAMIQQLAAYDPAKITGSILRRSDAAHWLKRVSVLSIEEQKKLPGLHPKRAGYIVAGFALIESFFDLFGTDTITVSDMGLRYGVLLQWMEEMAAS